MKQYVRFMLAGFVCTLLAVVTSTPAFAQGGGATTSLSGTVTDTSGAIIPGASVTVKNNAVSTEYTAVTNESGAFTVPSIDPGSYTVTVALMGFKTAVLNDVRVSAATPATIKVALEVGGLEETVVVQGGSEIIQTQSAAVTSTIDTNQILKLPTGSRSALEFVTTLPGVNTPAGSRDSTINGLPQSSINITIDGVSAQDNWLKTTDGFFARVSPRLDAIEEVTVSSAAQDAANTGPGRRADSLRHPLGQQQLQRQRLLLSASLQARRHRLVQQSGQYRAGRGETLPAWRPCRRTDRDSGTVQRPRQGVLLRQLRGVALARSEHGDPHNPAPSGGAGDLPVDVRRRHAAAQSAAARGAERSPFHARPHDLPFARRHPDGLDRPEYGPGRSHRSAAAAADVPIRHEGRQQVSDVARGREPHQQPSACPHR